MNAITQSSPTTPPPPDRWEQILSAVLAATAAGVAERFLELLAQAAGLG